MLRYARADLIECRGNSTGRLLLLCGQESAVRVGCWGYAK